VTDSQPDARARLLDELTDPKEWDADIIGLPEAKAAELLDAYRDQVLTEAAELIREHRGDLDDDGPWWDTRDRDTAAALLLAARTTTAPTTPEA
jgi:hypothetical protein